MKQNLTEKELKSQAHKLHEYLKSCGVQVTHSQLLEGLSRVHGWRNLATARANFEPGIVEHSEAATANWVTRILWLGEYWEKDLHDVWHIYPVGTTMDNVDEVGLESLRRFPDELKFNPKAMCATYVFAEVASIARYDVPAMASFDRVKQALAEQDLGVSEKGVDVKRYDRGDDGGEAYWVKVRMPQSESDRLDAAACQEYVELLAENIRAEAEDKEFAVTRYTLEDLAAEACNYEGISTPSPSELQALFREFGF